MRELNLEEYEPSEHVLSENQRDALQRAPLSLTIEPVIGIEGTYRVTPGSTVGAIEIGDLSVLIEPKIGITQLLSVACYAMSKLKMRREQFDYPREYAQPDVLALALASAANRAFSRGLLHGYVVEEEALHTVRGRIRFDEQIRRRSCISVPVEVRYDEFTEDILANRLVKAAVDRLGRMQLRSRDARRKLGRIAGMLDDVSLVEFPPKAVPEVRFDRLNEHYREVVALSRLVLRHSAYEASRGEVRAAGFLMDMNVVFQECVTQALREALRVSDNVFLEKHIGSLDEEDGISLKPDLTWWDGRSCLFVGDAKYKKLTGEGVPNSDLYQLLAYVTALDLPGGLLIYARGEAEAGTYRVRHSGKRLDVAALDLSARLDEVLARVREVAVRVKALRDAAIALRAVA
ncbi:MAG: restriction endonuclease [Chloroflexi bacterium]|nr:restriction endonuclease [Chloroflexota bacterium]